jgi:hypothetical protein
MNRHTTPALLRTVAGVLQRHCNGCDRFLPYDAAHFHHSRANKSGLVYRCKACICAANNASKNAQKVPRIGPRNAQGEQPVVWARYAVRNARRAAKCQ